MKKWLKRIVAAIAVALTWLAWGPSGTSQEQAEPIIGILCPGGKCPAPTLPPYNFGPGYNVGK